jgi:ABC-type nitrate/sulfonate/bicarbonate transport system substrate-binding protein
MWVAQWAARATRRSTVVVVLEQSHVFSACNHLCPVFTILYEKIKAHKSVQKVLAGAVNTAQESAEMAGKPDDGHGHCF